MSPSLPISPGLCRHDPRSARLTAMSAAPSGPLPESGFRPLIRTRPRRLWTVGRPLEKLAPYPISRVDSTADQNEYPLRFSSRTSALSNLVSLPKPTRPSVAQCLAARTVVVDPFPDSQHFLIPVIAGAHRDTESVARLPNCLAINEHQPIKVRLLRLSWVIDSSPEAPIDDKASLASRIHAPPASCA